MLHVIERMDDPRLDPYRCVKERELARDGRRFIAEGEQLVRRLLASDFETESLLLVDHRADEIAQISPPNVPVFVVGQTLMNQVMGIKFHSGVIACGKRKSRPTLAELLPKDRPRLTLVVCPDIANAENMGALIRLSAAFGVDGLLLGERCHDPFWRQSVRVSMGTIFSLPLRHSDDLLHDLRELKNDWNMQFAATTLDKTAEPLAGARRPARLGLLFGGEAQGLQPQFVEACDRRVTIPMEMGTDSLNVAVSAGIFLYHFMQGPGCLRA